LPGRTPREAVDAFVASLQDILSCVARAKINLSHDGWGMPGRIHALTVNRDQPITLRCRPALLLKIGMLYEIMESVIRTLVTEYGVAAMRDDWEAMLVMRESDFQMYRTWS
jgi:hypothetical protein